MVSTIILELISSEWITPPSLQLVLEFYCYKLEEELNSGFGAWLVSSGTLRTVFDLLHFDSKGGIIKLLEMESIRRNKRRIHLGSLIHRST